MREFARILLTVICLLSVTISSAFAYDEEIRFRDIPWDTDIVSFWLSVQTDLGYPLEAGSTSTEFMLSRAFSTEKTVFYFDPQTDDYLRVGTAPNTNFYNAMIFANEDTEVAGYPINIVRAYAMPTVIDGKATETPEQSQVVTCVYSFDTENILDHESAYSDLCYKLTAKYGEMTSSYNDDQKFSSLWLGEANTYVIAEWYPDEDKKFAIINLYYGVTSVADNLEIIKNIQSAEIDPYDGL